MTKIRLAEERDVEAIVELDRSLDTLPHWPVVAYSAAIGDQDCCVFVTEAGGEILGLAVGRVVRIAGDCEGELESVGVAVSAQRRGLGRELCRAVIAWCLSQGAAHVDLEVRGQSAGAITLYRELGFVAVGSRRGYYRDPENDAVLMRLDLERELDDRSEPGQQAL